MSTTVHSDRHLLLGARFRAARRRTLTLCEPLTAEDMMVQSTPEASPAKWHLAHTAWFFEAFLLRDFLPGYRLFNEEFVWLFNSYYVSLAAFPEKRLRASFSRPPLDDVLQYRKHVDEAMERLMEENASAEVLERIELGVNHEEQHQELLLTDILHAFFTNPLRPVYRTEVDAERVERLRTSQGRDVGHPGSGNAVGGIQEFHEFPGGLREAGYGGEEFCFDNELALHRVWLEPYALGARLATCREFAEFIADGGYRRPELWLSAGWTAVESGGWKAPLYWTSVDGEWSVFTLRGELPLTLLEAAPVSHVSYFEADAYARWAGCRLPTEFEWEVAAESLPVAGNLLDSGRLMPAAASESAQGKGKNQGGGQFFGDCWEWTTSAYLAYPGFRPLNGALGEYNGKFMSGQMVLRGGSCFTPSEHIRPSYRNFFPPETRWQCSGIRLAR